MLIADSLGMNTQELKDRTKQLALWKIDCQPVSTGRQLACRTGERGAVNLTNCRFVLAKLAAWLPSQARCLTSYFSAARSKHDALAGRKTAVSDQKSEIKSP